MVQVGSFEEPVGQVRNGCFDYFKHASLWYLGSFGRDQVILLGFHLEIVAERRFEADIIERRDFVAVGYFARIQNGPFGKLSNAIATLFILLILLDAHLTVALKCEEISLWGLEADRRAKSHWLLGVTILEVEKGKFFTLANLKIRDVKDGVMSSCYSITFIMINFDVVVIHNAFQSNLCKNENN